MVAYALQFYALGLTAHAAVEITVRAFYALHDTWTPVAAGVAAMILNIGLSFLLVGRLSYGGLALANTTATTLEMAALLWLLRRKMGGLEGARLGGALVRSLAATAAMAAALRLWLSMLAGPWDRALIAALGGIFLAAAVYLAAAALLRSEELRPALRLIAARRGHHR